MTHVMRHTFASHYIKNGGDVLELKQLLGHTTLEMTMRYAHLAPNKTDKVLKLNPITEWTL
jgi:site-specific recombinase XerD